MIRTEKGLQYHVLSFNFRGEILLDQLDEYQGLGIRMSGYPFAENILRISEYSDHSLDALFARGRFKVSACLVRSI